MSFILWTQTYGYEGCAQISLMPLKIDSIISLLLFITGQTKIWAAQTYVNSNPTPKYNSQFYVFYLQFVSSPFSKKWAVSISYISYSPVIPSWLGIFIALYDMIEPKIGILNITNQKKQPLTAVILYKLVL